jgi:hypothetical protein
MSLAEPLSGRIATLRAGRAEHGIEGALISWAPHIRFLSSVISEWHPAYLLVAGGQAGCGSKGISW